MKKERAIISNLVPSLVALITINGIISGYGVYVNGRTEKLVKQLGQNSPRGRGASERKNESGDIFSRPEYQNPLQLRTRRSKTSYDNSKVCRYSSNNNDTVRRDIESIGGDVETEEFTKRFISAVDDGDKVVLQRVLIKTLKTLMGTPVSKCAKCGATINEDLPFCGSCGIKLARVCRCGADISANSTFCSSCGAKYEGEDNFSKEET